MKKPLSSGDFSMDHGSPNVMGTHHKHHHIEINYLLEGELTYLINGESVVVTKETFALFWAGLPHQTVARSDGVVMLWINLPLSWFMAWVLPQNFKGDVLNGGILCDQLSTDTLNMERWFHDYQQGGELREIAILEIEARVKRMGLRYKKLSQKADIANSVISDKVTKIIQYISDHLEEDLSIDQIALQIGLHPNYMMTLFKKEFGYSINQYMTRLRVASAQRLLVTTNQKVLQVAYACGFRTPSRFYAAFDEIVGCSPIEFKKQCLA